MQAEPAVIRTMLKRWGSQGEGRYYYDNWKRFLDEDDIELYRKSCGREPDGRAGIRVYFDDEGYLIIQYCPVESIEAKIEKGMHGWYRWAVKEARGMEYSPVNIGHLAIGYAEEIRPGIYRLRSKDKTVIVGYELLKGIEELVADYYLKADMLEFSTGSKDLDLVLRGIFYENNHHRKSYTSMYGAIESRYDAKKGFGSR